MRKLAFVRVLLLSLAVFGILAHGQAQPRSEVLAPSGLADRIRAGEMGFRPPPQDAIPPGPYGEMVRLGRDIFNETGQYARPFVGDALRCSSCHLDAGRLAGASPLWAAWVAFPEYRAKNEHVNTFAERLQGCFRFSMNGKPPPLGDKVIVALESYSAWLAQGAPVGADMPGRGYPKLAKPGSQADYGRGQTVYASKCALCHGPDGQGQLTDGQVVFPPLWGNQSYNWGAGMEMVDTAAAFIKANMPLGLGGTLSDQDSWDVALFMNSHERPQDPRFTGSVAETRQKFHHSPWSMYGQTVAGHLLGSTSVPGGGSTQREE
ncbi:MAG: c-type cytochrome [Acetobacteraceae bacterium]|nr:c-type cytochrome [Acetobacteraceae bacterium]